ncbi:hypothetical protein HMPREF9075_00401 [Capnocytophaga sp. oral taxon 332 str. F0381]|nr:hypothetical protein HMPREF9075_00401 [Capnocytophaga sp. oral taxon 332 str. F0381]
MLVIFITLLVYGAKIPVFIEYIALHKIIFSPSTPTCAIRASHTLANFQSLLKFFYPPIQNSECATHFGKLSEFAKVFLPPQFKIQNS